MSCKFSMNCSEVYVYKEYKCTECKIPLRIFWCILPTIVFTKKSTYKDKECPSESYAFVIDSINPVTISIKTHIKKIKKYISLTKKKLSFLF